MIANRHDAIALGRFHNRFSAVLMLRQNIHILSNERVGGLRLFSGIAPVGGAPFTTQDIGIVDPHVVSGEAVRRELESRQLLGGSPVVGTPEVWQGLERPLIIAHHPLSGTEPASAFSLDPGRLCVSVSRHLYGCVLVGRGGIEEALEDHPRDSGSRPLGSNDRVWLGRQSHLQLMRDLHRRGRVVSV